MLAVRVSYSKLRTYGVKYGWVAPAPSHGPFDGPRLRVGTSG